MKILTVLSALMLVLSLSLVMSSDYALATPHENLLENPGAETGNMSGWTIIPNGGDDWTIDPGRGKEGAKSFRTTYLWSTRYQEIDLLAKGYASELLDTAPTIKVGEWFAGYGAVWMRAYAQNDYAYLKVELRDASHNVIASYDTGTFQCPGNDDGWWGPWMQQQHIFTSYGPGLRYIYFEDGGKDVEYWKGYYGTRLDAAYVYLYTGAPVPALSLWGGVAASVLFCAVMTWVTVRRRVRIIDAN